MDLGTSLGGYIIREKLGSGGMAEVYRAHQVSLKRDVALKVLPTELAQRLGFQERFQQEAHAAAGLSHRNILTIYDYGYDDRARVAFIAMELITGKTLADRMTGPMELDHILALLVPICNALALAHERGIFHRDIKPANILIADDGRPVLADFGLAFLKEREGRITENGTLVGSPAYMSPEQAKGNPVDGHADQYSLGIVFYEMLTGQLPFQAKELVGFVHKHTQEPMPDPRLLRPELPQEVVDVVLRATAKDPVDRFPSIADFAEALQAALKKPVEMPPRIVELRARIQALVRTLADLDHERERGVLDEGQYSRRKVDLEEEKALREAELDQALRQWADVPTPLPTPPPTTMASPFVFGGAIQDPAFFYGRQSEIRIVLERLATRNSTSIVGERRIGKSSLLLQIQRRLSEPDQSLAAHLPSPITIYLDLMQPYTHTRRGIMRAVRLRLEQARIKPGWTEPEDGDLYTMSFALEDLSGRGRHLVLLLDEVDKMTERRDEFDDLLQAWRAAGSVGHISMVTASRWPLVDLCQRAQLASPFHNIFSTVMLGLLSESEWRPLVENGLTRVHLRPAPPDLAWMGEVAGGHPFYTQIAADLWYRACCADRLRSPDYVALTEQFAELTDQHLRDLWQHLDQPSQIALKHLAGDTRTPQPDKRTLDALQRRGLTRSGQPFSSVWAQGIREGWWE